MSGRTAFRRHLGRIAPLAAVLAIAHSVGSQPARAAPRVRVRGGSRIEMKASGPAAGLTVSGTVLDEVGAPIARARVVATPLADPDVAVPWASVSPCGQSPGATFSPHTDHAFDTDDAGGFCLTARLDRGHATLRAVFGGDTLHQGTRTDIVWDAAQRSATMSFAPRPERVDLDAAHARVAVRLAGAPGSSVRGLVVRLEDEGHPLLAEARTDDEGVARLEVPTSKLGGPGIGALRAQFAGTTELSAAETTAAVTRFARVRVTPEAEMVRADPERGVGVLVRVETSRGPVTAGSVEARLGASVVGTAPVQRGVADLLATFASSRGEKGWALELRYASDTPFYAAGAPAVVRVVPVRAGGAWRVVPVLAALAVAGWLLRGWRRPKRREPRRGERIEPTGAASVEVVGAAKARGTWSGRVVDAHDAAPVPRARVRVIAPSFVDLDVVAEVFADDAGGFSFHVASAERDLRMRVEAPMHAEIDRALPPPSEMVIALVSRRRMLLERLVGWARRAGRPWDEPPEPTPGHVARVARAGRRARDEIALWAQNVERKAYGPEPVGAREDTEVRNMEPPGQALR
jgi:hypothetical protein